MPVPELNLPDRAHFLPSKHHTPISVPVYGTRLGYCATHTVRRAR